MTNDRGARAVAGLNAGLVMVAAIAMSSLLLEHGVGLSPAATRLAWLVDLCCVIAFASLQIAKLWAVPDARRYLSMHKIDFSLVFVLFVGVIAHLGLVQTPEHRYLESRGHPSPLWAFYVGVLQLYLVVIVGLRSTLLHRLFAAMRLHPSQMLVASFLLLVLLGTAVLALPGATRSGEALPLVDALFTATSAVCVTGLVVRDTGTEFAPFGLTAIIAMIQIGGLGMLTLTGALAVFSGRGLRRQEQHSLAQALDVEDPRAMRRMLAEVLVATAAIEAAGALLLYQFWETTLGDPFTRAGWAVFHSVSAFCNAGFALAPRNASLTWFASDFRTLAVIGVLIVLGGVGFRTLQELGRAAVGLFTRRQPRPLSLQSRIALGASGVLIVAGTAGLLALEWRGILSSGSLPVRCLAAVFQSVSLRTAGFNSIELAGMAMPAIVLCSIWMLIGGSPGGTAGGIKTTTLAAVLGWAPGGGGIDPGTRRRALRVAIVYLFSFFAILGLVAALQRGLTGALAFEVASALGTVGLSLGATPQLTVAGKLVICVAMFLGRVGPFALAASLLRRAQDQRGSDGLQVG